MLTVNFVVWSALAMLYLCLCCVLLGEAGAKGSARSNESRGGIRACLMVFAPASFMAVLNLLWAIK